MRLSLLSTPKTLSAFAENRSNVKTLRKVDPNENVYINGVSKNGSVHIKTRRRRQIKTHSLKPRSHFKDIFLDSWIPIEFISFV